MLGSCDFAQAANPPIEQSAELFEPSPVLSKSLSKEFNSKLITLLYESCEENTAEQLEAVDVVMERIYKIGYNSKHRKKLSSSHKIYNAGNVLLDLSKKMYAHTLSVQECQKTVKQINDTLIDANVDID